MPPKDPQDPLPTNSASTPTTPPAPPQATATTLSVPPASPPATASGHVDLGKILLSKKETPGQTPQSAQRINAGILFEQERAAAESPLPQNISTPVAKPVAPAPKAEQPLVRPLQTYQGDIASLVDEKNISVVSIAAAEAERRGEKPLQAEQAPLNQERRPWMIKTLMVVASAVMLVAAIGVGFYIYLRLQPVNPEARMQAPFILVDDTLTVPLQPGDTRGDIMRALSAARNQVSLSLGLVARLLIVKPSGLGDGSAAEVGAPEFLQALSPSMPAELLRTLEEQMLLGIHSYDENQAFMIFKVDSYETAYSGMLAWEVSMRNDLSPLFTRTPAVRPRTPAPAPAPVLPLGTTTGTSTATSTPLATTTTSTSTSPKAEPLPAVQFFQGNFVDHVVENHDGRAVLNEMGDVLLLWTFLDRSTVVVTTNTSTLREVISRLSQASILSLPSAQ